MATRATVNPAKPNQRDPERTRRKLIEATITLAGANGQKGLSVLETARQARVSRRCAYVHFRDREHLLSAARDWTYERLEQIVASISSGSDTTERSYRTARLVLDNADAVRFILAEASVGRGFGSEHPLFRRLQQMYRSPGSRVRPDTDTEAMLYIHLASLGALLMLREQNPSASDEAIAARFTAQWGQLLAHGLLT